ncbi:RHS repeat-associated core domain-containing protein [Candidatus Kaiserbacteria bacterium]|nr:RHS repeat-associated core domain-containing protein [Candidatus Kaiserbacteria bacterium]
MNRVPYPGLASQFPMLSLDTVRTDRRFTGQQLDGSGLYYFNARYYDPEIGHFISPDTIVPDPMRVDSYNRYMYSLGNPLKFNDPSGHKPFMTIPGLPCPLCYINVDYSTVNGVANRVIDVVGTGGCFLVGCHVDRENDKITGPTPDENANSMAISLVTGTGMVQVPGQSATLLSKVAQAVNRTLPDGLAETFAGGTL